MLVCLGSQCYPLTHVQRREKQKEVLQRYEPADHGDTEDARPRVQHEYAGVTVTVAALDDNGE